MTELQCACILAPFEQSEPLVMHHIASFTKGLVGYVLLRR